MQTILNNDSIYNHLVDKFDDADKKYNSGLFKKEKWIDELQVDDKILKDIIISMYPEGDCPYEWSILPIEILGNIYERFLGSEIILRNVAGGKTTAIIEEKPEVKKAGGVYYTPKYIVDYIIKETVGKKLENATIKDADKLKILDMACGSGSFLIGAYKYLLDWYFNQYSNDQKKYLENGILVDTNNGIQLSIEEKKRILLNNIYGVDIDFQAVEVTKLSLFLQMLDKQGKIVGKKGQIFLLMQSDDAILPNLSNNIKCGNSLVGTDIYTYNLQNEFSSEERSKINAFNWEVEFHDIFIDGGFDIVIGNPPYIDSEAMSSLMLNQREYCQKKYDTAKGNWDIYILFIDSSMNKLRDNGVLMYITPDKWITKPFGDELRKKYIKEVSSIINVGRNVFQDAKIDSIITKFEKSKTSDIIVYKYNDKNKMFVEEKKVSKEYIKVPYQLDIVFSNAITIVNKLENNNKLSDYFNCENACATSDCYKLKEILKTLKSADKFDENKYYKVINTGTIDQYVNKWGISEMTYLKDKYLYPICKITDFNQLFKNSYAIKTNKKKIIIKGLTHLDGCIDFRGNIIPGKTTLIITADNDNDLKLISALINSKISLFYIKQKYSSFSYNGGINFQYKMINDLPWVSLNADDKNKIIEYVDYILKHSNSSNKGVIEKIKDIKEDIDNIYCNYFDLTAEEKHIVLHS